MDASGAPTVVTLRKGQAKLARRVRDADEADIRRNADVLLRLQGYGPADLQLASRGVDRLGHLHVLFSQSLHGLPVVGGNVALQFDPDGNLVMISGMMRKAAHAKLSAAPGISAEIAQTRAKARTKGRIEKCEESRLVFLRSALRAEVVLCWEVKVTAETDERSVCDLVYVDAATGDEFERHPLVFEARNRQIFDANQADSWGTLARSENGAASADPDVNTNYAFMGDAYSYFSTFFGRDSIDGAGHPILSTVDYRRNYNNAQFDSLTKRFRFGDGDGTSFGHFTDSREVVVHEYAHGVTYFAASLPGYGEAGAVNEAHSDIFGAMADGWMRAGGSGSIAIDANTWKIGEQIYTPGISGDALRYMDNPTADGRWVDIDEYPGTPDVWVYSRDWYPDRYSGTFDFGGVHLNSGIGNLAFKLMVSGGRHPRWSTVKQPLFVPGLGANAAQKIIYRALAEIKALQAYPGFSTWRAATIRAARDLEAVGEVPAYAPQIVQLAWLAVGLDPVAGNARPMNVSTRCDVGTGDAIAIAGFVVSGGSSPHSMLIRGIGPRLGDEPFNVPNALQDPVIRVFQAGNGVPIAVNDNWYQAPNAATIATTAAQVGAFGLQNPSLDAALLQAIGSGGYTVHLNGQGSNPTGNGMVEVYATDYNNSNHLVNISTRCQVTNNPAIVGFVIQGEGSKKVLIRAVGPTLGSLGVSGAINNPKLTLYVDGTAIRENDNWGTEFNAAEIASSAVAVGAFDLPSGSQDAAMLLSLPPGAYTAHMSGVSGATGIGLVELYEVN